MLKCKPTLLFQQVIHDYFIFGTYYLILYLCSSEECPHCYLVDCWVQEAPRGANYCIDSYSQVALFHYIIIFLYG